MNKSFDELESELRSLRPEPPSVRVRSGIAEQLSGRSHVTTGSRAWVRGVAALAIAAGVTVAVIFWPGIDDFQPPGHGPEDVVQVPNGDLPQDVDPPTAMHPPPTWLAYRHQLGESMESLDELLDIHATSLLASGPSSAEAGSLFQDFYQN